MKKHPPLWQLLVIQLDPMQFDFTVNEIAELCGLRGWAVRRWSRQLFPEKRICIRHSHRFDFEEAVEIIRAICRNGRGLPDATALHARLVASGQLVGDIDEHPSIMAAGNKWQGGYMFRICPEGKLGTEMMFGAKT